MNTIRIPAADVHVGDQIDMPIGWGQTLPAAIGAITTDGDHVQLWYPISMGAGTAWRHLRRHHATTVTVYRPAGRQSDPATAYERARRARFDTQCRCRRHRNHEEAA